MPLPFIVKEFPMLPARADQNIPKVKFRYISKRLKAISDEKRLKILSLLAQRSRTASEIAEELSTDMANLSYHLKKLREAGYVRASRDGLVRTYRINGTYKRGFFRFHFDNLEIRIPLGVIRRGRPSL